MLKSERAKFIRERWQKIAGVAISGLLPVSRNEIREETEKAKLRNGTDDSILDAEIDGVTSQLSFDVSSVRLHEKDFFLSDAEKRQLAREVAPFRKFRNDVRSAPLLLLG